MDRHELIVSHIPFVERTVWGMAKRWPSWVDRDDARSAGFLGLVDAADHFNPERGTPFKPYAIQRIRGAVRDWQRSEDWATRSSRAKATAGHDIQHIVHMDGVAVFNVADPHAVDPEESAIRADTARRLRCAVGWLRDRDRTVIEGVYLHGRTLVSLSIEMGVDQSRVWQIRKHALEQLRKMYIQAA